MLKESSRNLTWKAMVSSNDNTKDNSVLHECPQQTCSVWNGKNVHEYHNSLPNDCS